MTATLRTWTDDKGRTYTEQHCQRCGGSGVYQYASMGMVVRGVCFRCGGSGKERKARRIDAKHVEARARRQAAADAKRAAAFEAQVTAATSEREAWLAVDANRELVDRMTAAAADARPNHIIVDMLYRVSNVSTFRPLTDAQRDLATRLLDERDARAAAPAWTSGRQEIEGRVVALKVVENDFGGAVKMTVMTDDARAVYLTRPSGLDVDRGDRVRLTATVEPSADAPSFAFGSRPSKAVVLAATA